MKLIRDGYNEVITSRRLTKALPEDHSDWAITKLHEELQELAVTDWSDPEEYADVIEVLYKLMSLRGTTPEEGEQIRLKKLKEFGAFNDGLLLIYKDET